MSIHPVKTEVMFVSKMLFIGPIVINCVPHSLSLGVTLDNKLCCTPHIKSISTNFNAKLHKLKQMKTFDHTTLETIYFKSILPSATYCISLWGCLKSLQDLEDSHIRAEALSKAKWYSLSYLYKKRLAGIAYQAYRL